MQTGQAQHYDCVIVGGGPAGLSAALNLARVRRRVLLIDGNRPRNSATMTTHGFLTRDGVTPLQLRHLGWDELARYPEVERQLGFVERVEPGADAAFRVESSPVNRSSARSVTADSVLIATGLKESLPAFPSLRVFYGICLFSCVECDGYEQSEVPLVLIGDTDDVASRALLIARFSRDLTVFTNAAPVIAPAEEALLAGHSVQVERREIADVIGGGENWAMSGVLLADGTIIPAVGGFVRPHWRAPLEFAATLGLETDGDGLLMVDADGRTSRSGVYAAGDTTSPGPQQLIIAAGAGARAATSINRDLTGIPPR